MKQPIVAAAVAAGLLISLNAANAADVQAGKQKAAEVCASCHGPEGRTSAAPAYPVIAGQYRDYLVMSLKAYRSGAREDAIMAGIASGLSDRDIENLAAWFASRDGLRDLSID